MYQENEGLTPSGILMCLSGSRKRGSADCVCSQRTDDLIMPANEYAGARIQLNTRQHLRMDFATALAGICRRRE